MVKDIFHQANGYSMRSAMDKMCPGYNWGSEVPRLAGVKGELRFSAVFSAQP